MQKEILSAVGGLEWAKMTVKSHPADSSASVMALRSWAESKGYQNIRFGETGKFTSVVATTDIVACDFPSTTFLETLWAGVPVIVYRVPGAYELVDRYFKELSNAVYMVSRPPELLEVLRKLRNRRSVGAVPINSAEAFFIGRVPGFSGERQLCQSILE